MAGADNGVSQAVRFQQCYFQPMPTLIPGPYPDPAIDLEYCIGPGELGTGWAPSFAALVFWRAVTGVGSSVQYAGRELFLADISHVGNRGRTLGAVTVRSPVLGAPLKFRPGCEWEPVGGRDTVNCKFRLCNLLCKHAHIGGEADDCWHANKLPACANIGENRHALPLQALMMAGSFTGPALGGILADALGVRCVRYPVRIPAAALRGRCEQMLYSDMAQDSSASMTPISEQILHSFGATRMRHGNTVFNDPSHWS